MAQVMAQRLSAVGPGRASTGPSRSPSGTPSLIVRASVGGRRFGDLRREWQRARVCRPRGGVYGASGQWKGPGFKAGWAFTDSDLKTMAEEFDDLFLGRKRRGHGGEGRGGLSVAADAVETPEAYVFYVDLPGTQRSDTKVQSNKEERTVTVSGERFAPTMRGEGGVNEHRRRERRFGKFNRSFNLPDDADLGSVTAAFKDGVLSVSVPRVQPVQAEVVDIPIAEDWAAADATAAGDATAVEPQAPEEKEEEEKEGGSFE